MTTEPEPLYPTESPAATPGFATRRSATAPKGTLESGIPGGKPCTILFLAPDGTSHSTRWARYMRDRGFTVVMASLHLVAQDEPFGAVYLTDPPLRGATPFRVLPGAVRRLRALAAEVRPDVTVSYYVSSYGVLAALAGLRPLVAATAGGDVLEDEYDSWARRQKNRQAMRLVFPRCDRMLAWAPHVADRLVSLGYPRERILVQPRGVDLSLFAFREPRRRAEADPLRILSIRMLKPLYRVDTLIEALIDLQAAGIPFEAHVGGDGPERARLEKMAETGGISSRTRFLGIVPAAEIPERLAWSDLYVSTSSTDGASSSLFEAMAVGSYSLVTDIPANRPYARPGVTGELFPAGDSKVLAAAMRRIAGDEAYRLAVIRQARALAEQELDYGANMERILGFITAVASGDGQRRG